MQRLVIESMAVFDAPVNEFVQCIVAKASPRYCISCTGHIASPACVLRLSALLTKTRFQTMVGIFNKIVRSHDLQLYRAVHKLTQEQRDRIVRVNHEQFR